MDEISMEIEKLLDAVHRSDEYQEYQKQAAELDKEPELKARVMRFRGDNFRLQNQADKDELFQVAEQLIKTVKRKITDLDKSKIEEQKKAVRGDAENLQNAGSRDRHTDS